MNFPLRCWLVLGLLPLVSVRAQWAQQTVVAPSAVSFDATISGGTTFVAYESAGNIYVTAKGYGEAGWSAASLLGAGTAPSITTGTGGLNVAYLVGNNVNVSANSGSGWSGADLGNINGSFQVQLRTDSSGAMYLLTNGSGTGGRGSLDLATNTGSGWGGGFTNLAYGWYDSGSGNYYHQGVLAASPHAAGYRLAYEINNWGGNASWSDKGITTSGFASNASAGASWNGFDMVLPDGGLFFNASGGLFGYLNGGNAYATVFDGTTWNGAVNLGAASGLSVNGADHSLVVFSSSGNLMQWDGTTTAAVSYLASPLAGTAPLLVDDGATAHLLYLDGGGQLTYLQAIPEPAGWAALCGLLAFGARMWRRRPDGSAPANRA
ncbi:hypothetical protein Verru16b_02648 [Lacunisphaera limnophila]|uniref:PEP-CTERM protein-sorting domain-containing protein n=1 Tax=Lacunisphaera limnophila TaxID=1838286 RepID=A0A1D8AXE2_9BACT|nr:hypothetical protein [Lacunisphaera limnophila]AOS45565.1 hypothetical protein Verru16b_02648 [Lacunisphaera limnophila]